MTLLQGMPIARRLNINNVVVVVVMVYTQMIVIIVIMRSIVTQLW